MSSHHASMSPHRQLIQTQPLCETTAFPQSFKCRREVSVAPVKAVVCALPQPIACPFMGPSSSTSPAQCLTCCCHTTLTQLREMTQVSWRHGEGASLSQLKAAATSVTVHSWMRTILREIPLSTETSVWLHDIECWDNLEFSEMMHIRAV